MIILNMVVSQNFLEILQKTKLVKLERVQKSKKIYDLQKKYRYLQNIHRNYQKKYRHSRNDEEVNEFSEHEKGKLYLEEAWKFFFKFWFNSVDYFDRIKNVVEAETFLWTTKGGGWAGTVDNVSQLVYDKIMIIDYKNSRKPKREDWVQDYYMQAAAYFIAYWDMHGKKADGEEIWIANEVDNLPQTFSLTQADLEFYAQEFIKRRKMFQDKYNI